MDKILISAFSCNPNKGSESLNGWCWSNTLAHKEFEVFVLTRSIEKNDIEKKANLKNLNFYYISLPFGLEKMYHFSQPTMYLYYILWQWKAYKIAKKLTTNNHFHRVHHISWGSIQQGSFLYKLGIPFIFGPAGGGQEAPPSFKSYFKEHWKSEIKRKIFGRILFLLNPGCKKMLKSAFAVLVSNKDTLLLAKKAGSKNIGVTLDAALPTTFFPPYFIERNLKNENLKLLWVGRFLPRKGLLLVLEVMKKIRTSPNISLTIVGDGEMRKYVSEKIDEYGLQETVKWIGSVPFESVKEYYKSHDAFFFTSLRDSCPAQLIEAMAYGLPIITIDLHGQSEIVTDNTGIKVPLTTPEKVVNDLAQAIVNLSKDEIKYKKLSIGAYNFACNQTWDLKINKIVSEYY